MAPPPYHESVCHCRMVRAMLTKLPEMFLSIFARSKNASFGVFFSKNLKKLTSKIFGGPRALGENRKISKFLTFLLTNPTFQAQFELHMFSAFI